MGKKKSSGSKSKAKKSGGGNNGGGKAKFHRAQTVQKIVRRVRMHACTSSLDEVGREEAGLLKISQDNRKEEKDPSLLDARVYDEKDKNGAVVRTLDNFCVYDSSGERFALSRLFLDPSLAQGLVAYGTVVGPLKVCGSNVAHVSRAVPRDGDRKTIEDLLEKPLSQRQRNGGGGGGGQQSRNRNIKVPDYNPGLSREQAWSDATLVHDSNRLPLVIGGLTITSLGQIIAGDSAYHTRTHVFPVGFRSERMYASALDPQEKVVHVSEILEGDSGPIFQVTHAGGEPVWQGPSSSNVWQAVLNDLNKHRETLGMTRGGDSVSGPEMFGFANPKVASVLEGLPKVLDCEQYLFRAKRAPGKEGGRGSTSGGGKRSRSSPRPSNAPSSKLQKVVATSSTPVASPVPASPAPASASASASASALTENKSVSKNDIALLKKATQTLNELGDAEIKGLTETLQAMKSLAIDLDTLTVTGIGRLVNRLRKYPDKGISQTAKDLKHEWKSSMEDGKSTATPSSLAAAVECAVKIGSYIGFGEDGPGQAVQDNLEKSRVSDNSCDKILATLQQLSGVGCITMDALVETETGKPVARLRKHPDVSISTLAQSIKDRWEEQISAKDDGPEESVKHHHHHNGDAEVENKVKKEELNDSSKVERWTSLVESLPLTFVVPDKQFPDLKGCKIEVQTQMAVLRPRTRVRITDITGISISHGEYDGILWLETPSARYRIAGRNVPTAPAANYYLPFLYAWKRFEASTRFLFLVEGNADDALTIDAALRTIVDEVRTPCPRRVCTGAFPANITPFQVAPGSSEAGLKQSATLTRDDLLDSMIFVLDQITRGHKNPEKVGRWLAQKLVAGLIARGAKVVSAVHKDFIRRGKREEERAARLNQREIMRKEHAMRRMVEEGIGLPDDMDVVMEDAARAHEGGDLDSIENTYMRAIAAKQLDTVRPAPVFFPVDPLLVTLDTVCVFQRARSKTNAGCGDFKKESGAFGTAKAFSTQGQVFSEMLALWSGLKFLSPLLATIGGKRHPAFLKEGGVLQDFLDFRTAFTKSHVDDVFVYLVKFLASESSKANPEAGPAGSTHTLQKSAFAVEDVAGISTRRGRRSGGRVGFVEDTRVAQVPSYAYNADELWPVPEECITELSWPEVARRVLVHQLQLSDNITSHDDEEVDRKLSAAQLEKRAKFKKAIAIEPDLMSTCDELIADIMDDPAAPPFASPVGSEVPNYLDVIKRPMDLQTVQNRIRKGHYDQTPPELNRYNDEIEWARGGKKDGDDDDDEDQNEEEGEEEDDKSKKESDDEEDEEDDDVKQQRAIGGGGSETAVAKDASSSSAPEDPDSRPTVPVSSDRQPVVVTNERDYKLALDARFYDTDCVGAGHAGVAADVRQIWRNCRKFNLSTTKIYNDCKKLQALFKKKYEERILARDPAVINAYLQQQQELHQQRRADENAFIKMEQEEQEQHKQQNGLDTCQVSKMEIDDRDQSDKPAKNDESAFANTLDEIGPYQGGMPSLESAILEFKKVGDFSELSMPIKLRIATSLLDLALETPAVVMRIRDHIDNTNYLAKEFQKQEREDTKKDRELASAASIASATAAKNGDDQEAEDKSDAQLALEKHRAETARRRDRFEAQLRKNGLRLEPVGVDRYWNRYWLLDSGASPFLHVEIARTGEWGVFGSADDTEAFIESLDRRGARENALYRSLRDLWSRRKHKIAPELEAIQTRLQRYAVIKGSKDGTGANGSPVVANQEEVDAAVAAVDRFEKELEKALVEADKYREAKAQDDAVYYYHRETRETMWEPPAAVVEKRRCEKRLQEARKALETAKAAPEEMLETLKEELRTDLTFHYAMLHCSGDEPVEDAYIQEEAQKALSSLVAEGFRARLLEFVSLVMSVEFMSAAPETTPIRAAHAKAWHAKVGETGEPQSPRDIWLAHLLALVRKCFTSNAFDHSLWAQTLLPDLQALIKELFALFVGSPYSLVDGAAQMAVLSACKHEFRWIRAVDRAQTLPELSLLVTQLIKILGFTKNEERQLEANRKATYESLI